MGCFSPSVFFFFFFSPWDLPFYLNTVLNLRSYWMHMSGQAQASKDCAFKHWQGLPELGEGSLI